MAFPAILSLVSALLGATAGGLIAARSSQEVKATEMLKQREDEARKVRSGIYIDFLDSAGHARATKLSLRSCLNSGGACTEEKATNDEAGKDLSKKFDLVAALGSDGAVASARDIVKSQHDRPFRVEILRRETPEDSWMEGLFSPSIETSLGTFRVTDEYPQLRAEFQRQMCLDINPLPREKC